MQQGQPIDLYCRPKTPLWLNFWRVNLSSTWRNGRQKACLGRFRVRVKMTSQCDPDPHEGLQVTRRDRP